MERHHRTTITSIIMDDFDASWYHQQWVSPCRTEQLVEEFPRTVSDDPWAPFVGGPCWKVASTQCSTLQSNIEAGRTRSSPRIGPAIGAVPDTGMDAVVPGWSQRADASVPCQGRALWPYGRTGHGHQIQHDHTVRFDEKAGRWCCSEKEAGGAGGAQKACRQALDLWECQAAPHTFHLKEVHTQVRNTCRGSRWMAFWCTQVYWLDWIFEHLELSCKKKWTRTITTTVITSTTIQTLAYLIYIENCIKCTLHQLKDYIIYLYMYVII